MVLACPVCGAGGADREWTMPDRFHPTPGRFTVRRCGRCRSTYVTNPPEDLSAAYPADYYSVVENPCEAGAGPTDRLSALLLRSPRVAEVTRRIVPRLWDVDRHVLNHMIPSTAAQPRVLDVGCGSGGALDVYKAAGWSTWGVEPSRVGAERARTKGHHILESTFDEAELPGAAFDLVRMRHSIEHVVDPIGALRRVVTLLAPSGHVAVELPNLGSWLARLGGESYWQLDPPRHLAIPHPRPLRAALDELGLREVASSTSSYGFGIAATARMRLHRNRYRTGAPAWRLGGQWSMSFRVASRLLEPVALVADAFGAGDSLQLLSRLDR